MCHQKFRKENVSSEIQKRKYVIGNLQNKTCLQKLKKKKGLSEILKRKYVIINSEKKICHRKFTKKRCHQKFRKENVSTKIQKRKYVSSEIYNRKQPKLWPVHKYVIRITKNEALYADTYCQNGEINKIHAYLVRTYVTFQDNKRTFQ